MYTWKLTKNLTDPLDPQWEELAQTCLGDRVHESRKKGFFLSREALKQSFREVGFKLSIKDLKLKEFHRLPSLPDYTLSLSHTKDFGAALIAERKEFLSLGIDVENDSRIVKDSIINRIAHPLDLENLRKIEVWCLKEAVFKALMNSGQFPVPLEFSSIQLKPNSWTHSPSGLSGEWILQKEGEALIAMAFLRN